MGFWIVTRQVIFPNHKHFNEEALFEELSMAPICKADFKLLQVAVLCSG